MESFVTLESPVQSVSLFENAAVHTRFGICDFIHVQINLSGASKLKLLNIYEAVPKIKPIYIYF